MLLRKKCKYFKIEHGNDTLIFCFWDPYVTRVIYCKKWNNSDEIKKKLPDHLNDIFVSHACKSHT